MGSLPVWLPVNAWRAARGSRRAAAPAADPSDGRARREMWVETLEPLLGLLDEGTQSRLADSFPGFDARRGTRASILGTTVFAAVSLVVAALHLATDPRLVDAGVFLGAGLLGFEAWSRQQAWRQGRIRGSVCGLVLRPVARRLLS
jgi:hypothetical protein